LKKHEQHPSINSNTWKRFPPDPDCWRCRDRRHRCHCWSTRRRQSKRGI